jgi:hypothetical protein
MYQVSTAWATPRYGLPALIAAATGFGAPSAVSAGMYVPIPRLPVFAGTLVATRSRSPASFIRWKTVTVPPSSVRTSSTNGVVRFMSVFWPSHWPSTVARGSVTVRLACVNWLVAVQVAVSPAKRRPPRWASRPLAASMSLSTPLCTSSPTEPTSRLTSAVVRFRSSVLRSATAAPDLSANASLCQAPTPTRTAAVLTTPPRPSASSLWLIWNPMSGPSARSGHI